MNRSIRAAAVGLFGGAMALAVATGTASASQGPIPGHRGDQRAAQFNGIGQAAGAVAQSKQFLPINANVAPSLFSVDSSNGWVKQGNFSSANANAQNDNQSFQGNGVVQEGDGSNKSPGGAGCRPQSPASPWTMNPGGPRQDSSQSNGIGQVAGAAAQSKQILPINANVAPSVFTVDSNNGSVQQGNASSADANAQNDNQSFQGNGVIQQGSSPLDPQGPPESTQSVAQGNGIGQVAGAVAQSKQFLPINANVAPSVFTVDSNNGSVQQGNGSSANANAQNDNRSFQGNGAGQKQGGAFGDPQGASQSSAQGNGVGQVAGAAAQSKQVVPVNANIAPSLFTVGSNDGGVAQGNASNANANAGNSNSSGQVNLLGQSVGGPGGLVG